LVGEVPNEGPTSCRTFERQENSQIAWSHAQGVELRDR
jgi:hypothetical protein